MANFRQENEIVKSSYLPVLTGFILNDERLERDQCEEARPRPWEEAWWFRCSG